MRYLSDVHSFIAAKNKLVQIMLAEIAKIVPLTSQDAYSLVHATCSDLEHTIESYLDANYAPWE